MIQFTCHECGWPLSLATRPRGGRVPCPECHAMLDVPGDDADGPAAYATAAVKRCPLCRAEADVAAVLCIDCGYNFKTGRQTRQVVRVKPVDRRWTFGFVPFYFVNVRLQKTESGNKLVTLAPHALFLPLGARQINLRECDTVVCDYRQGLGAIGLTVMLVLLFFLIVPGLWWWWMAVNKENYVVQLPYGKNNYVTIYEGMSESTMRWVLDEVAEVGGLRIARK